MLIIVLINRFFTLWTEKMKIFKLMRFWLREKEKEMSWASDKSHEIFRKKNTWQVWTFLPNVEENQKFKANFNQMERNTDKIWETVAGKYENSEQIMTMNLFNLKKKMFCQKMPIKIGRKLTVKFSKNRNNTKNYVCSVNCSQYFTSYSFSLKFFASQSLWK